MILAALLIAVFATGLFVGESYARHRAARRRAVLILAIVDRLKAEEETK